MKIVTSTKRKILNFTFLEWIIILGYFSFLLSFLLIFFCSNNIKCSPRFDYTGFNNFYLFFSFPIKLLIGSTTLLGINIAYKKYNQDSQHFKKQFKQQNKNIKINNYYLHMNEFIMSVEFLTNDIIENKLLKPLLHVGLKNDIVLKDYANFTSQKITKYFSANIYKIWFGHLYDSDLHIKKNILLKIEKLYDTYLSLKENTTYFTPDELYKIEPTIKKLGLKSILLNTNSETSNIYIYLIFRICKHILEFDNKNIENESKLYERLKI